jgi:hypothetical protein
MRCNFALTLLLALASGSTATRGETPATDSREWVEKALKAGEQLIDHKQSQNPLEVVKEQWRQNALSWVEKGEILTKKIDALPDKTDKKMPREILGEMMLFTAYTTFIRSDTESIVMKQTDSTGLICHLIFNTKEGLVDIAYCYDENGNLKMVRFDGIPNGVFVSIASGDKSDRVLLVHFSEPDVTIALDRLDPFAAVVADI